MPHDCYIGIDNGVSGSIGIIGSAVYTDFFPTPTKSEQNYTKAKGNITRIDLPALHKLLKPFIALNTLAIIERPMVNPTRFQATLSAIRALEAILSYLEMYRIAHMYIDSKQWQKVVLPQGVEGSVELKKASLDIGKRLYPEFADEFNKQKDADGMLIAHWAYMEKL